MTMKHYRSNTPEALAYTAHRMDELDSVADILGRGEDHRSVTVYYEHHDMLDTDDGAFPMAESYARIIGVVLGGDDPGFMPEVLDRDGARDLFGDAWVQSAEDDATERLWE
jgi:hypothetical protein